MPTITMLIQKGCLFSAVNLCQEVFLLANTWWKMMHPEHHEKLIQFELVSPDGLPVKGGSGMVLNPHRSMELVEKTEMILIPPYLNSIRHSLLKFDKSIAWLQDQYAKGSSLAGLCTGTFVLAQTGLLDGRIATTNWQLARSFRKMFPKVNLQLNEILTVDENLICTGASTAILDLYLYILKKYGSEELANNCSKALLIDPVRKSQAPYIMFDRFRNHGDPLVAKAQNWLEDHFTETILVDSLAKDVGLSSRQFQRRFKEATGDSPVSYLQKIRIEVAKEKLSTTRNSFGEITWEVGYEDINSFRKMFKRHTSLSPKEYRQKFDKSSRL